MSRKSSLTEFNRQNIINAAKEVFSQKGFSQTTMDEIAQKADYSKSTIYAYFNSKDEIYNCIILEYMELLKKGVISVIEQAECFNDGYFALCKALETFYDTYPIYFESILGTIKIVADQSENILSQIYKTGEEINGIIERYIERAMSEKQVKGDLLPLQTTFTLWASICGIIVFANNKKLYIQHSMCISKEQFMQNAFTLLLNSVLP